ncbi:hypothetical protein RHSIM_Rhsim05G0226900 [Rhododendron simsii]|uniref:Uncharacterized protein n=1 Tax=Rhododendron simsii TaxID=118357 RepID=A0A834GZK0_RHOSS|nr:hypothetical protein RHSIM_Rhsim05G0226900 [Rhododendron simsii]
MENNSSGSCSSSGGGGGGDKQRTPLSRVVSDCVRRWFQETLKEAKAGDLSMQVLVGQMYFSGYGVPQDAHKVFLKPEIGYCYLRMPKSGQLFKLNWDGQPLHALLYDLQNKSIREFLARSLPPSQRTCFAGHGGEHGAGRVWMTRASRVRSSVWKVSNKRPGYNASDSDSDDSKGDS